MSRAKIFAYIETLEATLETLDYQIDNLQKHYSPLQVRAWYKRRAKVRRTLAFEIQYAKMAFPSHYRVWTAHRQLKLNLK